MSVVALIVSLSLTQNVILVHYLGVYPLPAIVHSPRRAAIMSLGVTAALVWVALLYWAVYHTVLVPLQLEILDTITVAIIIAVSTIGAIRVGTFIAPFHHRRFRQGVPAAMVNVTVFVVATALVESVASLGLVLAAALATGAGLFLALVPMAAIRSHLRNRRRAWFLRGDAAVYLAAALMALAIQQVDRLLQGFYIPLF